MSAAPESPASRWQHAERRSDVVSLSVVAGHLALVLSPVYGTAAAGPGWLVLVALLVFGLSMNGVLNLMHECAHRLVFRRGAWSDVLGRWIVGPLVFADFDRYRERHWAHHRYLGEPGDTKDAYRVEIRRGAICRLLVDCLSGRVALHKFLRQESSGTGPASWRWLGRVTIVQLIFGGTVLLFARAFGPSGWIIAAGHAAIAYGVVYVYGLMSLTVFMATLRAIAEHQTAGPSAPTRGSAALRNFTCSPVSRWLMGAYGFGEHYTHHVEPAIPYYQLGDATRALAAHDLTMRPGPDYFAVLATIVRAPTAPPAARSAS